MSRTGPDSAPDAETALSRVRAAAGRLEATEASQREAAADFASALYDAHRLGLTWVELAQAAGLASPETARSRAERSESAGHRRARGHASGPDFDEATLAATVSVAEAAATLRVSRPTVYAWASSGRLQVVRNESNGRIRVLRSALTEPREG